MLSDCDPGIAKGEESKKGTFYFKCDLAAVNVWSCREHPEHLEVALFTMSSTEAMAAVTSFIKMTISQRL
jgi:hypothetical protein